MDQKTIDDRVNALLEERLKDLGIGKIPENHDNPSPQLSDNFFPALVAAAPGKEFGPKKNLAKELEKESGVKRTLDEVFGSVDKATDMLPLDFVVVSPAKATKDDKLLRILRLLRIQPMDAAAGTSVLLREADEKKKAVQADAAYKRKKKAEAKKKAAEDKKKEAEAKKKNEFAPESDVENFEVVRSAIIKDYREKNVRL
ncbi:LOW QUALITY PROTEIN: hypothetical protein HID58_074383, partial [Brassica napus]